MDFVRWTAEVSRPTQDGSSTRAHLEASARRGNASAIAQLTPPPFPAPLGHVWTWWQELHAARQEGMSGLSPLTYRDLDAWARMTGREPEPHEVALVLSVDATFRAEFRATVH